MFLVEEMTRFRESKSNSIEYLSQWLTDCRGIDRRGWGTSTQSLKFYNSFVSFLNWAFETHDQLQRLCMGQFVLLNTCVPIMSCIFATEGTYSLLMRHISSKGRASSPLQSYYVITLNLFVINLAKRKYVACATVYWVYSRHVNFMWRKELRFLPIY